MFKSLLEAAGFDNQTHRFHPTELLALAREHRPATLKDVEKRFLEKGQEMKWEYATASFIWVRCLATDALSRPRGVEGEYFSFKVTSKAKAVQSQMDKLARLGLVLKALGVEKSAVVLLTFDEPKGFNTWRC